MEQEEEAIIAEEVERQAWKKPSGVGEDFLQLEHNN